MHSCYTHNVVKPKLNHFLYLLTLLALKAALDFQEVSNDRYSNTQIFEDVQERSYFL